MVFAQCQCTIFFSAGCKHDSECRDDQACINRECQNPCLFKECGRNAICQARNHRANCICPPNHTGSPEFECRPYECLIDPDCHVTLACRQEKCVDPCPRCGVNAACRRQNHKGFCYCLPGFTGNPEVRCTESKSIAVRESPSFDHGLCSSEGLH